MAGRLTTHVLCTSSGRPAEGVAVKLVRVSDGAILAERRTNDDGRLDKPLLEGPEFEAGTYELEFQIGDYYRRQGVTLAEPPFLDIIPIRFGLAEATHYHVPLLVSPYGFSTYRGS